MLKNLSIFLPFLLIALEAKPASLDCGFEALPSKVRSVILRDFPDWKLVTIDELRVDDQLLWKDNYTDKCPGFIFGTFNGHSSVAVSLIRRENQKTYQALIVVKELDGLNSFQTVRTKTETDAPAVLLKFPPGKYFSANRDSSIITHNDSIAYVTLEADGTLYYFVRNKIKSLDISE